MTPGISSRLKFPGVWRILNPTVFRIPKIWRFFSICPEIRNEFFKPSYVVGHFWGFAFRNVWNDLLVKVEIPPRFSHPILGFRQVHGLLNAFETLGGRKAGTFRMSWIEGRSVKLIWQIDRKVCFNPAGCPRNTNQCFAVLRSYSGFEEWSVVRCWLGGTSTFSSCCHEHDIQRDEPHVLSFLGDNYMNEWKQDKDWIYESISQRSSSKRHPYRISASHLFPMLFRHLGLILPASRQGGSRLWWVHQIWPVKKARWIHANEMGQWVNMGESEESRIFFWKTNPGLHGSLDFCLVFVFFFFFEERIPADGSVNLGMWFFKSSGSRSLGY